MCAFRPCGEAFPPTVPRALRRFPIHDDEEGARGLRANLRPVRAQNAPTEDGSNRVYLSEIALSLVHKIPLDDSNCTDLKKPS